MTNTNQINSLNARMTRHHEDTSRHTDADWKNDIRKQLDDIRALLINHMRETR